MYCRVKAVNDAKIVVADPLDSAGNITEGVHVVVDDFVGQGGADEIKRNTWTKT